MSRETRGLVPTKFGREEFPEENKASLQIELEKQRAKEISAQIREARKAGDTEKADQLQEQMGQIKERIKAKRQSALENRDEKLWDVKDFEPDLRRKAVGEFRDLLHNLQAARKAFRKAETPEDKKFWRDQFTTAKKTMDSYLDNPEETLQLEKAYVAWTQGRAQHSKYLMLEGLVDKIKVELAKPTFSGDSKEFSNKEMARLERLSKRQQQGAKVEVEDEIKALKFLYKGDELEAMIAEVRRKASSGTKEQPDQKTKAELEKELAGIERKLDMLWDNGRGPIAFNEGLNQQRKLLEELTKGTDVIEMPSTIHSLNRLAEWERLHRRTTIGGVLVGEPGTGKTTLIHHYLELRNRNYVYLDMSEEVTRYMLFGTKSLEFKSPSDFFGELAEQIGGMTDEEFQKFIKDNAQTVADTYNLAGDEAEATFFRMLQEELNKAEGKAKKDDLKRAQEKMTGTVGEKYHQELAKKFKHLVQKNGWRDGVIIAALRRGDSVILDEFVKSRDLTLLYGLTTAKPGEDWYFEDNDEHIKIPEDWRMYFTGNIGRRHASYRVAEALASRAQGKIMEVNFPPKAEELTVGLAELCDAEGTFLRSKEDIASTSILIGDVFPKIRTLLKTKEGTIPISWRTIRDIGEKVVETKKNQYGKITRRATNKNFDQAVYEVLAESYKVYEDKTVPREVVNICTSLGLLLDDKLKNEIVDQEEWLTEDEWQKRRDLKDDNEKDWDDIVAQLKGEMAMSRAFMTGGRPERIQTV